MLVTDHQFTFHGKTVSVCLLYFLFKILHFTFSPKPAVTLMLFNRLHSVVKIFKRRFKKLDTNTLLRSYVLFSTCKFMSLKVSFTLSRAEKVTPCSSRKFLFPSMAPCLFSSQVPLPFFSVGSLKFVEEHQAFLRHEWLQDIKLGDSNLLTTWPVRRLCSSVVNNAEREGAEFSSAARTKMCIIPSSRMKSKVFLASILQQKF